MCLDRITKRYSPPVDRWQVGYKVLWRNKAGDMYGMYYSQYPLEKGIVYTASPVQIVYSSAGSYVSGFHTFKWKKDAKKFLIASGIDSNKYVLVRVKVHNITVSGQEYFFCEGGKFWSDIRVAQEMEIVEIFE